MILKILKEDVQTIDYSYFTSCSWKFRVSKGQRKMSKVFCKMEQYWKYYINDTLTLATHLIGVILLMTIRLLFTDELSDFSTVD